MTDQPKLSDVQSNLHTLNQRIEENEQKYQEVQTSRSAILRQMQSLVETEVPSITERELLLQPRESELQPKTQMPPVSENEAVQESADVLDLFRRANAKYNKAQYTQAAEQYGLVYEYAETQDIKARSLYRMGNCHYNNRNWEEAINAFITLEIKFPTHLLVASGMLKKGYAQINQGELSLGQQTLQLILDRFPNSTEASLAKERLKELKS